MHGSNDIITFGCRLNAYESEVIRARLGESQAKNTIVINSCAVTAEAERQVRQAIRRAKREYPDKRVIVTGCAAQIHPERYAELDEVDLVLGNEEKLQSNHYSKTVRFEEAQEKAVVNDIMSVRETASHLVAGLEGRTRAFVQVQNGCDHRCTFCIIPFGRGPSRSVPIGDIVRQVRELVASGYREIVLTGVDITDYGKDLPGQPTLGQMISRLLALVPELPRLRLSSIDAVECDADLYRLLAEEPRLMPHIHISLQAGDDMVLKRMKRRHLRQDILDFCEHVRRLRPDVVFGADIIAGFPTETDAMFENTLNLVAEAGLTYLHVFPYSSRPGTPASKMPQVPKQVRKERAARLREAGQGQLRQLLTSKLHQKSRIIIEKPLLGRTEHFCSVMLSEPANPGDILPAYITGIEGEHLTGRAILNHA